MKVRNTKIAKKDRDMELVHQKVPLKDAVAQINRLQKSLNMVLFERSSEILALTYAVLTRNHVMLEGPPGVAKSMLARSYFGSITGFDKDLFFRKQLTKTTQPESLFGPVSIRKLRENETYEHNTSGALPRALFAYLDEVYRASSNLLPDMFSILNERVFYNGHVEQKCPLITAVGTTNFTIDDEELTAFHDRWLIRVKVESVKSKSERLRMYQSAIDRETEEYAVATVPIHCFTSISKELGNVTVDETILEVYDHFIEHLISSSKSRQKTLTITDRRRCESLKLAQVSALLREKNEVAPEDLDALKYGFVPVRDQEFETLFAASYQHVIGDYEIRLKEKKELDSLKAKIDKIESVFDPSLSPEEKFSWHSKARHVYRLMDNRPERLKISENQNKFDTLQSRLSTVISSYAQELKGTKFESEIISKEDES